ncbi:PREDICTED: B3 domain-containing protein REM7 isoform X1 [Camelina sativa]|uniref:B3 domain-containing protein REM7 isoform X1 n=1 Tax=Camelina sativa TaxID=90675 RepID=A0ABM1QIS2_CAMSA|nr:PREDICTED: B3 domain-containing protein REM7 isoform X1 [Camelina sativa]
MLNSPLQSPTNPHFFQPLLPGSETHLTIPVVFFSKHIGGKHEQKTAKLKSDSSEKTWVVKMDGRRLTQGWKEFVKAHDLRIGDIIIFKHEGDMVFRVTPFGPSCCEIQYAQCNIKMEDDNDDEEDDMENQHSTRNGLRKTKLNPKTEAESFESCDYCFVANVTASNLKTDTINLPKKAASSKALSRRCDNIILVNEEGNSWTLNLRFRESDGSYYMGGGWKRFCSENRQKEGDLIAFNLVGDGESNPMLCICQEEVCSELMSIAREKIKTKKRRRRWVASPSSPEQNRFVTLSLTSYNIKNSKLSLPVEFTKINGINNNHKKIILEDKHGVKRLIKLIRDGPNNGRRGLGKGWKLFCRANDVLKVGEPFQLKLLWENKTPLLKFWSKFKEEPI